MALDTANALTRFYIGNLASGTTANVFTVTTSHIFTLKNIRVVNNTAGAISFKLGINGVADANLITATITLAAGETYNDDCFIVMASTNTFQANTSATGLTLCVSGLDQS
jgi:hypothetical protein